ncbi:MAG: GyrI-like domain-containing protein [Bacteroidota bacterium]
MKALKIIGIIVGVLVAAILIVPLFSPATAEVSAEIDVALEPSQIFPGVASFQGRDTWDPWLTTDTTAEATIESKPGFVGSTYAWKGEKVGFGKMEVMAVKENEYIQSNLWFGDVVTPAMVEWSFEASDAGTHVVWSFSQETAWPFERLGMMIGKVFLQKSFDLGLANLKAQLEANPPQVSPLGPITIETQEAFEAMLVKGSGTMEEMAQNIGQLFGLVFFTVGKQQLEVSGPAFVHYLDYDEATGFSNFLAGVPVASAGKSSGDVMARSYPEMIVVQALHTGPYEKFIESYIKLDNYIKGNGIEVTGQAFEFYNVDMQMEPDPARWETLITFPVK